MELREFISVRRAYSVVRGSTPSDRRLTFEEYAILCHLRNVGEALNTSTIASYQGVLRPTMTHRTNHLANLGLIERHEGALDHRNVCCSISSKGDEAVSSISKAACEAIAADQPLGRIVSPRLVMYVDAMGSVFCTAGDLVLLILDDLPDGVATISQLVVSLGLLQPTVSMAVRDLVAQGLVERGAAGRSSLRVTNVLLVEAGRKRARVLSDQILDIVVRRARRS
jgi:DNA-binding MarR family transcriptional regulator